MQINLYECRLFWQTDIGETSMMEYFNARCPTEAMYAAETMAKARRAYHYNFNRATEGEYEGADQKRKR